MIAIVVHANQPASCAGEAIALHDAAPGCHPCATCNALGASRLCLQRGQSRCRNGREPVRQSLQLHSFLPISRPSVLSYAISPHQSRHRATLSRWWGRSLPSLMTCAHTQELQRTLPGARRISFADESGVKLWARSQWTKAIDGDAAAHERKSPARRTGRGLCQLLFQATNPAQTG